jgi:ABC-2 type transport system permease protein
MRAWAIGWKDVRVTVRDRSALGILLVMPMVLILILGSALGGANSGISHVRIAVVNQDRGTVGKRITDAFFDNERITELFDAQHMRDAALARDLVSRGDLAGAVVVPDGFSKGLNSGRPVKLTVYTDPGYPVFSAVLRSIVDALSTQISAASVAARTTVRYMPANVVVSGQAGAMIGRAVRAATETSALEAVGVDERLAASRRDVTTLDYYASGMSVMFLLFGSMFGAFSMVRERSDWTLPRMLTSPASKLDVIGGKMLGVFVVGVLQWSALFGFALALGVHWADVAGPLWALALATVAAATGLAVLLSTVGTSVRAVSGVGPLVIQLSAVAGGSMIPVSQFPAWLQPVRFLTVNGWAIDGMLAVMRGGGFGQIWGSVVALLVMAGAFFAVGVWRLRWQ